MPQSALQESEFDVYHLYDAFRKRIGLLIGIVVVGVLIGFVLTMMMEKKYETSVLATSTILENHESAELIGDLQEIISNNDLASLSKALHTPKDTARTLKEIKAVPSESGAHNFEIQLVTTNPSTVPALLQGIQLYCKNSNYPGRLKSVKKESLERMVYDYERKLKNLDSLQRNIDQAMAGKQKLPSPLIISDIYSDYTSVRRQLEENRQDLQLLSILEYYNDPYISQKPDSPKLLLNLVIAFVVSVVLAVFLIVFLAMVDYFRQNAPQNFA